MTARTTLPALIAEEPLIPQPPVLVLFGRDRAGKPRAAWFDGNQAKAALAAADTMKLRALPLMGDEQRVLAAELAHGRILPSGKAHVPGALRDLYGRFVALAGESAGLSIAGSQEAELGDADQTAAAVIAMGGTEEPSSTAAHAAAAQPHAEAREPIKAGSGADGPPKPQPGDRNFVGNPKPRDREEIGLGSVVLAHEGPEDGWWEAEVIGINDQVFSLRWRDYPTQPTIVRKASELALLPTGEL